MATEKTPAPALKKLKIEPCSIEEIQAAMVEIIELHNKLVSKISNLEDKGRILSSSDARNSQVYGL